MLGAGSCRGFGRSGNRQWRPVATPAAILRFRAFRGEQQMKVGLYAALVLATAPSVVSAQAFSPAEKLAAAKAAGFQVRGTAIFNECDSPAEQIAFERQDLNADGKPEIVVSDGGGCYGNGAAMFVVLRVTGATWSPVLSAQGMMTLLKTRYGGWSDIEIGGPGFGKMPVARWNC